MQVGPGEEVGAGVSGGGRPDPGLQLEFGYGRQGVALLVGGLRKDMWKPG